jgi:tRNA pseudouridine32 synthase/23S rRNA pseudouridine746 synthase
MVCSDKGMEASAVIAGLSGTLHADGQLLVLDKPAGLLAVPGRGPDMQDCLATRVQRVFPDALVVHRLDMATSGLFLMARGIEMQRRLSRAFEQREVGKRYVAVVAGRLEGDGVIDLPLAADWPNRPRQVVDHERGKPSRTLWRVPPGHDGGETTRVELEPVTGRSHQLRVHMQALGHPILGDTLYAPAAIQDRAPRLFLHASALAFAHPATGASLQFSSAPPF